MDKDTRSCEDMTEICFPRKISLLEFLEEIENSIKPFKENMKHCGEVDDKFVEDWMRIFCAWNEMI
ncbi:MAG: hypothetical protein M0R17_01995 [Candidatus Omnitrophica bacterium]|jgi:hypothetical protein|nr:hypothetical protein [Candidatus Omnitrophota bacterium]